MKSIIVSVTNDLEGDQRVHRVCLTLKGMGFRVLLVGRKLSNSPGMKPRGYPTRRMWLLFKKGPLFYAEYNLRLLILLIFSHADLLLSNDLDTLPANYLASGLKRIPLVYDSHELFTEVPELIGRPGIKKIWEWIGRKLVPGVDQAYTVSGSIAAVYAEKYGIPFSLVRNLPMAAKPRENRVAEDSGESRIIIYQGALNKGRGLEHAINAMQYLPEFTLLIAGSGDIEKQLKAQASGLKLSNVVFTGRLPLGELYPLTRSAGLGISIEEDMGFSYRYALPNKLFDYIQARIPVVVSDLPEMRAVVEKYGIGLILSSHDPENLAETFRKALTDESLRKKWADNLEKAAAELTWEKEEGKLKAIFEEYV